MIPTAENLVGTWQTGPLKNDKEIYTLVIDGTQLNLSSESDSINYPLAAGSFVISETDNEQHLIEIESPDNNYSKIRIIDFDSNKFTTVIETDENFREFKKQ